MPKRRSEGGAAPEIWSRRSIANEPRLSELVALYESLGLEVRLDPLRASDLEQACDACFAENADQYKVIFTRPLAEGKRDEDFWPGL